jgi:hypothetical protein
MFATEETNVRGTKKVDREKGRTWNILRVNIECYRIQCNMTSECELTAVAGAVKNAEFEPHSDGDKDVFAQ